MARKRRKPPCGKPELEDGYVRIANELWQALIDYNLTAAQMKILAVIIRETYGYNRKSKNLSVAYLANAAHISKTSAGYALNKLIQRKVVVVYSDRTNLKSREIGVNKYYLDWAGAQADGTPECGAVEVKGSDLRSTKDLASGVQVGGTKPIHDKDTSKNNTLEAKYREIEANFTEAERRLFGD